MKSHPSRNSIISTDIESTARSQLLTHSIKAKSIQELKSIVSVPRLMTHFPSQYKTEE